MAPNPRRQDEKLQAVYDKVPKIDCKGLCSDSCGPIATSTRERQRVEAAARKPLTCQNWRCTMLTPDNRCGVYDLRPMICRIWGVTEDMPCPFGCVPEGGYLTTEQSLRLMHEAMVAGGHPGNAKLISEINEQLERLSLGDPEVQARLREAQREIITRPTLAARRRNRLLEP